MTSKDGLTSTSNVHRAPLLLKQSVGLCALYPYAHMRSAMDLTIANPELDGDRPTCMRGAATWCRIGAAVWVQILKACVEHNDNESTRHIVRVIDLAPDTGDLMLVFMSVKFQFDFPMTYVATAISAAHSAILMSEVVSFVTSRIIDGTYTALGVRKPVVDISPEQLGTSNLTFSAQGLIP